VDAVTLAPLSLTDVSPMLDQAIKTLEQFLEDAPKGPFDKCSELESYAGLIATNQVLVLQTLQRIIMELDRRGQMLMKLQEMTYALVLHPDV
jgi:hypothetical protein